MESNIKGKKQKKRAKGINKSEPPRREQKTNFLARIFPRLYYAIKTNKSEQSAQKNQQKKRRFCLLLAYHRQKQRNINAKRPFCACIDYLLL